METKTGWGGRRPNQTGRPKGTVKDNHNPRPQHQVRAFDDEWELIKRFAKLVKQGKLESCKQFLEKAETTDGKNTAKISPQPAAK